MNLGSVNLSGVLFPPIHPPWVAGTPKIMHATARASSSGGAQRALYSQRDLRPLWAVRKGLLAKYLRNETNIWSPRITV